MSVFTHLRSTDIKPRTAVLAVVFVLVFAAGAGAFLVKTLTGKQPDTLVADPAGPKVSAGLADAAPPALPRGPAPADSLIVERNLFRPSPAQMAAAAAVAVTSPAQGLTVGAVAKAATSGAQAVPFGPGRGNTGPDLYCTGIVKIGDESFALLESAALGFCQYIPVGGTVYGNRLVEIGEDYVVVESQGKTRRLNLQNNKPEAVVAAPAPAPGTPPAGAGAALTPAAPAAGAPPSPSAGGPPQGQSPGGRGSRGTRGGGGGGFGGGGGRGGGGTPPNFGNVQPQNGG